MAFVDLEKAFNRVPHEVVWWALRRLRVDEWFVRHRMRVHQQLSNLARKLVHFWFESLAVYSCVGTNVKRV